MENDLRVGGDAENSNVPMSYTFTPSQLREIQRKIEKRFEQVWINGGWMILDEVKILRKSFFNLIQNCAKAAAKFPAAMNQQRFFTGKGCLFEQRNVAVRKAFCTCSLLDQA